MTVGLRFERERRDSIPIIRILGEVDAVSTARLRHEIPISVSNEDVGLVIDLSETSYIDSAGVNAFFEAAERFAARQLRLAVVVPDGSLVARVLTIVALDTVADVQPTVEKAISAVRGCPDAAAKGAR